MERMRTTSFFPPSNTSFSNGGNETSDITSRFQSEIDKFNRSDQERNDLMNVRDDYCADETYQNLIFAQYQRLLTDNHDLHRKVDQLENDLENEQRSRRYHQDDAKAYRLKTELVTSKSDNDPFCLVLIDGDGCIFQDQFLKAAADGGAEAAHVLKEEVVNLLREKGISSSCTIMVQIYMSLEDLARKLAYVGILNTQGDLKAFEQSFCNAQSLFSIVDVGRGKERADHKIKEMFRLFVNNTHCKQIVFGGCHDNGYIPNLLPYSKDTNVRNRLTLLETTSAEWQYAGLGFDITRFPSVFRDTPLPERRPISPIKPPSAPIAPIMSPAADTFVPAPGNVFSASPPQREAQLQSPIGTGKPPTPANGTPSGLKTYANIGGPSDAKTVDVKPAGGAKPARKFILYNADNIRLDPIIPKPDAPTDAKFKSRVAAKGKLCNNHHLRGHCYNGPSCQYSHDPPLSDGEKLAFRQRVRTTFCPKGPSCEDVDCYLGHNCPFGDREGRCTKPESCSFGDLHGIDYRPRQRYWADGEVEILRL